MNVLLESLKQVHGIFFKYDALVKKDVTWECQCGLRSRNPNLHFRSIPQFRWFFSIFDNPTSQGHFFRISPLALTHSPLNRLKTPVRGIRSTACDVIPTYIFAQSRNSDGFFQFSTIPHPKDTFFESRLLL